MAQGEHHTTPSSGRVLFRGLGELGVIVLGVLIALGADAWWQGREEGVREVAYLRALHEELTQAELALSGAIRFDSASLAKDTAFTRVLLSEAQEHAGFTVVFESPIVPTGTLYALTQTGEISLVQSRDLRAMMITHAGVWRSLREQQARREDQLLRSWSETIAQMVDAGAWVGPGSLADLRTTPGFIGNRVFHDDMLSNVLNTNRELLRSASELRQAVSDELESRE